MPPTAFDVTGTIGALADLIDAARQGRAIAPLDCRDQAGEARARGGLPAAIWPGCGPTGPSMPTLSPGCDRNEADLYCRNASVFDVGEVIEIKFEFRRGTATPTRISVAARSGHQRGRVTWPQAFGRRGRRVSARAGQ